MSSTPPRLGPWPDDDEPAKPPPSSSDAVVGVVSGLGLTVVGTIAAGTIGTAHGHGYSTYSTVVVGAIALVAGLLIARRRRDLAGGFFVGAVIGLIGMHPCLANVTSSGRPRR
jgi:hypothetical protein